MAQCQRKFEPTDAYKVDILIHTLLNPTNVILNQHWPLKFNHALEESYKNTKDL